MQHAEFSHVSEPSKKYLTPYRRMFKIKFQLLIEEMKKLSEFYFSL